MHPSTKRLSLSGYMDFILFGVLSAIVWFSWRRIWVVVGATRPDIVLAVALVGCGFVYFAVREFARRRRHETSSNDSEDTGPTPVAVVAQQNKENDDDDSESSDDGDNGEVIYEDEASELSSSDE